MRTDYKVLGDYIQLVDQRNRDLSVTNLLGVSIEKRFIPSIANIVGTDLSSYKIVRTGQFAYGPVTSRNGDKISIAYLDGEDCIISSSYTVFEVIKPGITDVHPPGFSFFHRQQYQSGFHVAVFLFLLGTDCIVCQICSLEQVLIL